MNTANQKRLFIEHMRLPTVEEIGRAKPGILKHKLTKALGMMLLLAAWFAAMTFVLCEMLEKGIW